MSYEGEGSNWVYFDDLKITHTQTNIVQYNEYYTFGMLSPKSWTRDDASNRYLYNQGGELNTTTGIYDLFFRNYDPATGRFFQVDPKAMLDPFTSAYVYAGNNPGVWNDPLGDIKSNYYADALDPNSVNNHHLQMYAGYGHGIQKGRYGGPIGGGTGGKTQSIGDFLDEAWASKYGGHWSNGQSHMFATDEEAFQAGVAYNFRHNSWSNTYYGSYEATLVGYMGARLTGILFSPETVKAAIDIVKAKYMYAGRPNFIASAQQGCCGFGSVFNKEEANKAWYSFTNMLGLRKSLPEVLIVGTKGGEDFGLKRSKDGNYVVFKLSDPTNVLGVLGYATNTEILGSTQGIFTLYLEDPRNLSYGPFLEPIYYWKTDKNQPGLYWSSLPGKMEFYYRYEYKDGTHFMVETDIRSPWHASELK